MNEADSDLSRCRPADLHVKSTSAREVPAVLMPLHAVAARDKPVASAKLEVVDNPLEPTIFHEPWWLELASAGSYEAVEVLNAGKTVGRLPFFRHKRLGLTSVDMPFLTHFLGPAIAAGEGSANNVFLKKLSITRDLIQQLPSASLTRIKLHHGITDAIAFQEQGFRTSVQFTHEIEPLPHDSLWSNLRNKTRNVIRRAQEEVSVTSVGDPDEFMDFYLKNLKSKGMRSFLDRQLSVKLLADCIERGRGRIIAARNSDNQLLAANFYVWDRHSYYFLLTTRSLDSGNGTTSLLLWEGIKDAAQRKLIFDSDGLNSNGSILFLAGYGGVVKPRYIVTRIKATGYILEAMHQTVWGKNFFVRG